METQKINANCWRKVEGSTSPPGVNWIEADKAFNFVLYSFESEQVTLLLYGENDQEHPLFEKELDRFRNKSGPIWHCRVTEEEAAGALYYAYRVRGPEIGHGLQGFDPDKILLDPYAQSVYFPEGFDRKAAMRPGPNDGKAPLGIIQADSEFDWEGDREICNEAGRIIYEMHVKGFTRNPNSGILEASRGTFSGVIEKIPYLQELGITAIELMPVFQYDPQEGNYWGYMPLNFFSPHAGYVAEDSALHQKNEFRRMVKACHQAGIEIILDVVYNHTCESDHEGPAYCFKGIDPNSYYLESTDPKKPYADFSGCGNTLNPSNVFVKQLVMESLRYWRQEMRVDGFRFDLASIFSRKKDGSIDPYSPIINQIYTERRLMQACLIAEPWDAAGHYQLGTEFPGWLWRQWNGDYRDTLQRFVKGEPGMVADLMTRIYGSADLFPDGNHFSCRPWQSINYITSHDGSTLHDLVSYEQKYNQANGQDNLDGCFEFKWNCGWEGEANVPEAVARLRKQQVRNFCALLFLSNGTPMFRMGDEFLQTQHGNNNAYNQDNETSWLDWSRLEANQDIFRFFKLMIAFRKANPSIARSTFWRDDIRWYGADSEPDLSLGSRSLAYCLRGSSIGAPDLYVMINSGKKTVRFNIQEGQQGQWLRIVDTALPSPEDIREAADAPIHPNEYYQVKPHSIVVLRERS